MVKTLFAIATYVSSDFLKKTCRNIALLLLMYFHWKLVKNWLLTLYCIDTEAQPFGPIPALSSLSAHIDNFILQSAT